MAHQYSKGWFIQQLKTAGIRYHPLNEESWSYTKRLSYDVCMRTLKKEKHKRTATSLYVAVLFIFEVSS